jgi:hypothetical protein
LLTSMLIVFMLRENNTEGPKFNNGRVIISMCILLYWNWFLLAVYGCFGLECQFLRL